MGAGRSCIAALAHCLEEDFEVVFVDFEDAGVEGPMPCPRIAPLLGVEESQTKFAISQINVSDNTNRTRQRRTSCGPLRSQEQR